MGVFINSDWSAFGNSGFGHVRNSELGTTSAGIPNWGHSDLGRNRAVKTNRFVHFSVNKAYCYILLALRFVKVLLKFYRLID